MAAIAAELLQLVEIHLVVREDSLRRSLRRETNLVKFDMRDYFVRKRGEQARVRRNDTDAGRRWVHLTPIDDEGAEPLEIFDDPAGPRNWSSADPDFGKHRVLEPPHDRLRGRQRRRRSRRAPNPFADVRGVMTERYGVPVS